MEQLTEIQEHLTKVTEEIFEIKENQKNERLRKIEFAAVLEGVKNYLTTRGFSEYEIDFILLDYEKEAFPERFS